MDRWEASLEECQESQTLDTITSIIHTAEGILKEDLAPFEIDWFIQTLLSEPVALLDVITTRLFDDAWKKILKDAYKLLSDLVETQYDAMEQYIDAIVLVCQKTQKPETRALALQCLSVCVKRTMSGVSASQYIAELSRASNCKGPLAILVGTICEYHPELVANQFEVIRKTYLILLGVQKNSDTVCKALLNGVWCMFKNFGTELPLRELSEFYDRLRENFTKCESAVIAILRDYASLFKEKLASDAALRRELWACKDLGAILPVYTEVATVLDNEELQNIYSNEVRAKTLKDDAKLKFIALRVRRVFEGRGARTGDVCAADAHAHEYALRAQIDYETAEAVLWCIETHSPNSVRLLQAAILFYNNIPASHRKSIVVDGFLNLPADDFNITLNFLTTQTCQDENTLQSFLPLWRDILDSPPTDKRDLLIEKFVDNLLLVVDHFLQDGCCDMKLPPKLSTWLSLYAHIAVSDDSRATIVPRLLSLTRACGPQGAVVGAARATGHAAARQILQMINIDDCNDETLLCESCLAIIQMTELVEPTVVLQALEIIFSRKDADSKTLSLGIHKLEQLLISEINNLDEGEVSKVIKMVDRLKSRQDLTGKDARILQRDATVFLGKYWGCNDYSDSASKEENTLMMRLQDVLTLDLPNPIDGATYKIKLGRLLQLAIVNEHEESLRMLINVICANLCSNESVLLQEALGRAIVGLCRATVGSTRPKVARDVATFCNVETTLYIIKEISTEKSPASRRVLSEVVECILLKEQASNEALLLAVCDEASAMMDSGLSIKILAGLEITDALLTALKYNSPLSKDMLPKLLLLIIKTQQDTEIFEKASALYIENIALFPKSSIENTIEELFKSTLNSFELTDNLKVRLFRNKINCTLEFTKKLIALDGSINKLQSVYFESNTAAYVYLWSELPRSFEGDIMMEDILSIDNSFVLNSVFNETELSNEFLLEAHLRFLNQYAELILRNKCEETLIHISKIIERITPEHVKLHRKHLSELMTTVKQIINSTPNMLLKSFEVWSECIQVKTITEHLEKEKFVTEHETPANALRIMFDIFKLKDPGGVLTTVSIFAKTWARTILRIYASGVIEYLKGDVPYLSDLLSVSLTFLTVADIKKMILEGRGLPGTNANVGMEFCIFFMHVFVKYLVKKPFLLVQNEMEGCAMMLNAVVRTAVRIKLADERTEEVLELVNQLWPKYISEAPFKAVYSLLLDLSCIDQNLYKRGECVAFRYAAALVGGDGAAEERIALIPLLPGGDEYRDVYVRFASSLLPSRLSDVKAASSAALRAALDALSHTADSTLLDICAKLAQEDDEDIYGWWDEALTTCMSSLASSPTMSASLLLTVEQRARREYSVCRRILLPLIRYSPTAICEEFFSAILKDLLQTLSSRIKAPSLRPEYSSCVSERTIILDLLQLLFEKVPASKIESPSSSLYKNVPTDKLWHAPREVIRTCFKLFYRIVIPDGANPKLTTICREFRYAIYKCMCVCLCVRRVDAHMYRAVLEGRVWKELVDENVVYELPLKTEWNQLKVVKPVSIKTSNPDGYQARSSRSRSSSTARVFLRTLSENPLDFDLVDHGQEPEETQDVVMPAHALSGHPLSATLTALLAHLSAVSGRGPLVAICESLKTAKKNAAWLLAQAVCNNKEVYTQHANDLRPALLAVLVNTKDSGLNSLHIDILKTLIFWEGDIQLIDSAVEHLNTSINALIQTALENTTRKGIFRMLDGMLNKLLKLYGVWVTGDIDFEESFDDPNRRKSCIKLLLRFAHNEIRVSNLLTMLMAKLEKCHSEYRTEMSTLAELIGLEIRNCSEQEKRAVTGNLKKILKVIESNNLLGYLKILQYSGCCDQQQFRTVVDKTHKLPEVDRKRCLRIISDYMSRHPDSEEVRDLTPDIRQMAGRMSGDRCLEELLKTPQSTQPLAKRARASTSRILATIDSAERALRAAQAQSPDKTSLYLTEQDMATRFVEAFYLAFYLPLTYDTEKPELSVCLSTFYGLLFSHLKSQRMFKSKRLRNEPMAIENPIGLSRSHSQRTVGTLRSRMFEPRPVVEYTGTGVDVQTPVEMVLDSIIEFSKVQPQAGMELMTQLLRCLGREFDSRPVLGKLLSKLLKVAPQVVAVARESVDQLWEIDGFLATVEELKTSMLGSEGEHIFKLLHEEILIRCQGSKQFVLGVSKEETEYFMEDEKEFSIEEMSSAFKKLCNWDELTVQDRRRVESHLPVLWAETAKFKSLLGNYTDSDSWFGKAVSLYRDDRRDLMRCLRSLERWPRRPFVISSIMEAIQWHTSDEDFDIDKLQMSTVIRKEDCLVEWTARLMLRNVYLTDQSDSDEVKRLSRSHELRYCERANEMGLYNLALSVVDRNFLDLDEDEVLKWREQSLQAIFTKGIGSNDFSAFEKAVDLTNLTEYFRHSSLDTAISVHLLKMKMEYHMNSLNPSKIGDTIKLVEEQITEKKEKEQNTLKNKNNLDKLYKVAVLYYDGIWNENGDNDDILRKLCEYLGRSAASQLDVAGVAAILLNRLAGCENINETTAKMILLQLKPIISELPECYLEQLKAKLSVFPADTVRSSGIRHLQGDSNHDILKKTLQLLCDANYLLHQYCDELQKSADDETSYMAIYNRMESRIFGADHAGSDFKALATHQSALNSTKSAEPSLRREILEKIISKLMEKPGRSIIRLAHVCLWDEALNPDLDKLLQLRHGEHVVKILDEIDVFTDSLRRPCVVTMLTSVGRKLRYLLKNEDLRIDAAVAETSNSKYRVIPLSEDCGLIEYLEDHKRLKALITSSCDIEIPIKRRAANERELILMSEAASVQKFDEICKEIPAHALRSAIEGLSASVEDFVNKKRRFLETLSEVTIFNWIFGLGDRHLENMLYSIEDGGLVCIDLGAIFQYGSVELPPARLTRNILAVCDTKVLESKLQERLCSLRESSGFLIPKLKIAFRWIEFKLSYAKGILEGKYLAQDITKETLANSEMPLKNKYIEMLDKVLCSYEPKVEYSVEEQISSLLTHCTNPWILSVTRDGWEPWL